MASESDGDGIGIQISAPNLNEKILNLIDVLTKTAVTIDNITQTVGKRIETTFDHVDADVVKITDDVKVVI